MSEMCVCVCVWWSPYYTNIIGAVASDAQWENYKCKRTLSPYLNSNYTPRSCSTHNRLMRLDCNYYRHCTLQKVKQNWLQFTARWVSLNSFALADTHLTLISHLQWFFSLEIFSTQLFEGKKFHKSATHAIAGAHHWTMRTQINCINVSMWMVIRKIIAVFNIDWFLKIIFVMVIDIK